MSKLYLIDDTNISFRPETCEEAVILFHRLEKESGTNFWDDIPRTLIHISRGLTGDEADKFYTWVTNPYDFKPSETGGYFENLRSDVVVSSGSVPVNLRETEVVEDEKTESSCPTDHIDNNLSHSEFCTEPERTDLSQTKQEAQPIS